MMALIPNIDHGSLLTRRSVIGAAAYLICMPAIVRVRNLMPVRRLPFPCGPQYVGYCERLMFHALEGNLKSDKMSTYLNGEIVSEADARRIVKNAQA
jgi:hypothetical protein